MAINFPNSPTSGSQHTENNKTWTYNGNAWISEGTGGAGSSFDYDAPFIIEPKETFSLINGSSEIGSYWFDEDIPSERRKYIAAIGGRSSNSDDSGGLFVSSSDVNGDENALLIYNDPIDNLETTGQFPGKRGPLLRVRSNGNTTVFGDFSVPNNPAFSSIKDSEVSGTSGMSGPVDLYNVIEFDSESNFDSSTGEFTVEFDGIYCFSMTISFANENTVPFDDSIRYGFYTTNNVGTDSEGNTYDNAGGYYNLVPSILINPSGTLYNTSGANAPDRVEGSYHMTKTLKLRAGSVVAVGVTGVSPGTYNDLVSIIKVEFNGHKVS